MKTILKISGLVIVAAIAFVVVSSAAPYSEGLQNAQQDADGAALLFVLLNITWLCLAIWYIVHNSAWKAGKLGISLVAMLVGIYSFMMQIETWYFHDAFPLLTQTDILWIFIANGIPIVVAVPIALLFFKNKDSHQPASHIPLSEVAVKIAIIGLVYIVVYFVFGYFIAWQVEDLRLFYTGNTEEVGFFAQQINNIQEYSSIYPFQFLRGMLFGLFILPLVFMFKTKPKTLFVSIFLVCMSTVLPLTIPNPLFPDSVRWAHFWEMASSMFLFSVILWYIFAKLHLPITPKSTARPNQAI